MMSRSSIGLSTRSGAKEWPNVAIIVVALLSAGAMARPSSDTSMELGSDSTRIYGGYDVKPGEYPFLVSIDDRCGGSIIGQRHILTAAHCVLKYISVPIGEYLKPVDTMQVKVGAHYRPRVDDGQLVLIESIKVHEKYHVTDKGEPINDIAILETKYPIAFRGKRFERGAVGSIELPWIGDYYTDGELLTVAGWGMVNSTRDGELIIRPIPSQVKVPVLSTEKCLPTGSLAGNATDWEYQICAGVETGEEDSCNGDSGGPLFWRIGEDKHELIGIVSFGPDCKNPKGKLGVYTRVAKYIGWIMLNTKDQ